MTRNSKRSAGETKQRSDIAATGLPIIALGASAGGLQALTAFFDAIPDDSGMAFVVVHHVDPEHESLMGDILSKHTKMPANLATDGVEVAPNHVYVIPPNRDMRITDGKLCLSAPEARRGMRLPIDLFLRSLAGEANNRAVTIILSGTGSDGTLGAKAIKEHGGMVIAQEPKEASHDGMPRSVIQSGSVDHILPIARMPDALKRYCAHPYVMNNRKKSMLGERAQSSLDEILVALKAHCPVNFRYYKEGTLLRRIERRMGLRHVESSADYLCLLKASADEAVKLCDDLLIGVTSFFRDPQAFEYLEDHVLPGIVDTIEDDRAVRVWVPGCATGEEAYSIAMLIIELISKKRKDAKLQVFATDVDLAALDVGRAGVYPDSIEADISQARLKRFFTKEDHTYRVTPELRESVVFANQNLLADAPFSKLDLICCRNLLIYLNSDAQERVISMFHFALNEGGVLFLGLAESIGNHDDLFRSKSKKFRVFRRIGNARHRLIDFPIAPTASTGLLLPTAGAPKPKQSDQLAEICQKLLIDTYAPAAVLINSKLETLYVHGPTDRYLKVPHGTASNDLLAMARNGLRAKLGTAVRKAVQDEERASASGTVTRGGETIGVTIEAHPLTIDEQKLLLVTFSDIGAVESRREGQTTEQDGTAFSLLEQELESTRQDLQGTIRDLERSNEELKAANEEAMSMNEEFQSTNEELETSKEELQSLNEELTTLNSQLQQKVEEERRLADDVNNLLSSSDIATLFLDRQFKIRRFTPAAKRLFNVISSDVDRHLGDITSKIDDPDLLDDAEQVLADLTSRNLDVQAGNGDWFTRRILPYRSETDRIDGVVITYSEITSLKNLQQESSAARHLAESIVDTVHEPLLVLNGDLRVIKVSQSFCRVFKSTRKESEGRLLYELGNGQWDVPELRRLLERVLPESKIVDAYEISHDFPSIGPKTMLLNARKMEQFEDNQDLILLAIEDITEAQSTQRKLSEREARLSAILSTAPDAIISIDEDGLVGSFSAAAERIFGYTAAEVIGSNVKMLMAEPYRSEHDGYLKHYRETGEKRIIGIGREVIGKRKDGTDIPVRLAVSELWIEGKRFFTGILHDLTEENRRQEELQRAQKMEAIGQLTGGIAHDFNNLLTVIIGNLELLQERLRNEGNQRSARMAQEAAELGAKLTHQLLAFAKRQPLAPTVVALNDIVRGMGPLLDRALGEEISIESRLADDLKRTKTDPGQIENAILNMCLNARDAMAGGGTVTIETRNIELDADYATTQPDVTPGPYVLLSVTDNGTGMSPDVMERVFEPFFTTKGPGSGTGLGLSMLYGFAKQSGGHVAIYSEVGKGTTVNLYLPPVEETQSPKTSDVADEIVNGTGETILLVDDNEGVRELTITRLEVLGYNVIVAESGAQAIEALRANEDIDLVLSDVIMPGGISGFDVAEQARAIRPDVKILLNTGYADGAQAAASSEAGVSYKTLHKPYKLADLATALRELLD
jgi:two-component system, chemotaxis family, CheB/CheR fusion protein